MKALQFPRPYTHDHPPVQDVNKVVQEGMSRGHHVADRAAAVIGSWPFILGQTALLVVWVALNVIAYERAWDPYPFNLLNMVLSMQAACMVPIIMMSQNREAMRDRIEAHHDFVVNEKAEVEIRAVLDHLAAQDKALEEIHRILATLGGDRFQPPSEARAGS